MLQYARGIMPAHDNGATAAVVRHYDFGLFWHLKYLDKNVEQRCDGGGSAAL